MNWFYKLNFKQKLLFGCYSIVGLFALATIVLLLADVSLTTGIIIIAILIGVSYPIINFLESSLSAPIKDIAQSALQVSKGDFSQTLNVTTNDSLGELGHAFNSMIIKLREILRQTTDITRHVSESSREMYHMNHNLKLVMEQVTASSNELAIGAAEISEDVASMSDSVKQIEQKVESYTYSTKEMNERSALTVGLVAKGRTAVETQSAGMQRNIEATDQVASTIEELARQADGIY